jgi:hypothetical protein
MNHYLDSVKCFRVRHRRAEVLLAGGRSITFDSRQGRQADSILFDHREVTAEVRDALQRRGSDGGNAVRRRGNHAKQNDPALCRQTESKGQLPEILIECQNEAAFGLGEPQYALIGASRKLRSNPHDVMTFLPEYFYGLAWEIFVREEPHRSANDRIELLGVKHAAGISNASLNVPARQTRIVFYDLSFGPPLRQKFDNELHRDTRAFDDRLSCQDLRIQYDAFLPGHRVLPSIHIQTGSMIRPVGHSGHTLHNKGRIAATIIPEHKK